MLTIDYISSDTSSSVRARVAGFATHVVHATYTFLKLYSASEEGDQKKIRTSRFKLAKRNSVLMIHGNTSTMIIIFCLSVSVWSSCQIRIGKFKEFIKKHKGLLLDHDSRIGDK